MGKCPNCKQEYEGACTRSYGCVYATTSVSQIDRANGYNTTVDGTIISVNPKIAFKD